jgi:ribonuclease HII
LQGDIFADDGGGGMVDDGTWPEPHPTVRTLVKADQTCASVSAASVLAKCERDQMMIELALTYPGYDWASNKGYGSASHIAALSALGVSAVHRRSWNLPGIVPGSWDGPADRPELDVVHGAPIRWEMMDR